MPKDIYDEQGALTKLLNGVNTVADTVKQTLGPKGRNIILQKKYGSPVSCSDGVTIARDIQLADRLENSGAQFLIEASKMTNDQAGDGTTTVCVLAQTLINEGFNYLKSENAVSSVQLVDNLNAATDEMIEYLKSMSIEIDSIEQLTHVATISCGGNEKLGKLVAEAVMRVGENGVCTAEPGNGTDITVTHVEGMAFDRGYISPGFMTDIVRQQANYADALVFVTAKSINNQDEILPVLQRAAEEQKPILIICENLSGQALLATLANIQQSRVQAVAVRLPGFSTFIEPMTKDICAITGAHYFDAYSELNLATVTTDKLGKCRNLKVTSSATTFTGPEEPTGLIAGRLEQAQADLKEYKANNDEWAVTQTLERIARLDKGASLIQVGARTELEQQELLYRVEDAVQACKAALEEGIVIGAGNIQLRLADKYLQNHDVHDCIKDGTFVLIKALRAIYDQLLVNCECNKPKAIELVLPTNACHGFSPIDGKEYDLYAKGIFDPAKVTRCSLENAVSVATTMLRTAGAVVEAQEHTAPKSIADQVQDEHAFNTAAML